MDARADLLALKKRLEQHDLGERIVRQEKALASHVTDGGPEPLWHRMRRLFGKFGPFGRRPSRIDTLENQLGNLRKAVIDVVETEYVSLSHAVKNSQATAAAALEQVSNEFERVSVDIADHYETWTANYARNVEREQSALRARIDELESQLRFERLKTLRAIGDLDKHLKAPGSGAPACPDDHPPARAGENALLERFAILYGERLRRNRDEAAHLRETYLNDFKAARRRTGRDGPIIDVACGTGELVEVLRTGGFQAMGIDPSEARLDEARRRGLPVVQASAVAHLRTLEAGSVVAVAGIGVVERLPFVDLVDLVHEASRVLMPGGLVLFEMLNSANPVVVATSYYADPQVRLVPVEVLHTLLDAAGFEEVVRRALMESDQGRRVAALPDGPRDYAILGVKG